MNYYADTTTLYQGAETMAHFAHPGEMRYGGLALLGGFALGALLSNNCQGGCAPRPRPCCGQAPYGYAGYYPQQYWDPYYGQQSVYAPQYQQQFQQQFYPQFQQQTYSQPTAISSNQFYIQR